MTTHSKLPWSVRCEDEWDDFGIHYSYPVGIVDADNDTVLMFDDDYENLSANAKLIVDAVNGHTAAIQRERDRAERAESELKANTEYHSDCMNKIDEALGYPRDLSGSLIDEFVAAINLLTMAARIRRGEA